MPRHHVNSSALIQAPADRVYAILRDYRDGHPRILPAGRFPLLKIEAGGIGAGTELRVAMRLLGKTMNFRMVVTEPEPGRVLMESDAAAGTVTTFTVEPEAGYTQARVTIATEWPARPGVLGALERLIIPPAMRRVFDEELGLLAALAEEGGAGDRRAGR